MKVTSMNLPERVLCFFSRNPVDEDYIEGQGIEHTLDNALNTLTDVYPRFLAVIQGKDILDFGCGHGYQVVAMAMKGAKHAVGIDIRERLLETGKRRAIEAGVTHKVSFCSTTEQISPQTFDIVISQNSMEHFVNPGAILETMKCFLKSKGTLMITFGPPWYSPRGSHTHYFTKLPWVNILFSEKTVMHVRSLYRKDAATRYEEIEGGLAKMSVGRFEALLNQHNLEEIYRQDDCVKNMNILGKIPFIRELFINRITCALRFKDASIDKLSKH